ncbi:MAG: RtcB family protein, partial [Ignavibacteriales bacterium]|nr:RtcB family protein [Ignavibacteriales bacterium]
MKIGIVELNRINDFLWEIPKSGNMKVPGRIFASKKMLEGSVDEGALQQVINVAHLPGIQKFSLAMPDIHWGYGFPIGGVAATDLNEGVISPGGVGYDINCGVRLARTSLHYENVKNKIHELINEFYKNIPTGVGAKGAIEKLSSKEVKKIMEQGAAWAVENNFGTDEDLEFTEENGCLNDADTSTVSERAIERGLDQAGTLGSGNHFMEIEVVDEIFDNEKAESMGLFIGQIVLQIHSGSRGLGYQI